MQNLIARGKGFFIGLTLLLFSIKNLISGDLSDCLKDKNDQFNKDPRAFHHTQLEALKVKLSRSLGLKNTQEFQKQLTIESFLKNLRKKHRSKLEIGEKIPEFLPRHLSNFIVPSTSRVNQFISFDWWLVNLRGVRQDPAHQVYDQEYPEMRLKYFVPLETAFGYRTLEDFLINLAILPYWSNYSHLSFVRIPAGSFVDGLVGLANSQDADEEEIRKHASSLGIKPSSMERKQPGGGVQLFINRVSKADIYDQGSLFQETGERFVSRLGDPINLDPYIDPREKFQKESIKMNLFCHLLNKNWKQKTINFKNIIRYGKNIL